jgi:cobalt-zinc-cadmium efflux system outer membrane protein
VARRSLESARAGLAATWGGLEPRFLRVEGQLEVAAPPPDPQSARSWLPRNPDLRRWDHEIARREAVVALEDARRIPDVTAGVGPRWLSSSDDTAIMAAVSVPIPVFDRNQGARAAARSDLRKAEHERRAVHARLSAALASAYQELAARFDEVTSLRDEIVPGAEEAFEQVRRGYRQGLFRNVDVLDAQRRLFELRLREIEALRAYRAAATELERITGTPLSERGSARP